MEGLVVAIADEIAQRHHDIEDAINFGILSKEEICEKLSIIFEKALKESRYQQQKELLDDAKNLLNKDEEVLKVGQSKNKKYIFMNKLSKFIVDFLTTDVINKSKENLIEIKEKLNIDSNETFIKSKEKIFEHKDILDNSKKEDFIEKDIYYLRDNKVFFTNPLRWDKARVYIYKEGNYKSTELSPWPGREMYREGENLYSYPIEDYWISGRVIFTNGNTQIPEFAKEGLPILKNK